MLSLNSCIKFYVDPDLVGDEVSLIPGECLIDNELTCVYCNSSSGWKSYLFQFAINVDVDYEIVEKGYVVTTSYPKVHRHIPSDSVFQQFGSNSRQVKEQYNNIWSGISFTQCTFFYEEGIMFTADKDFAGIPAGENLAGLISGLRITPENKGKYIAPFGAEQGDMLCLGTSTNIYEYGPSNNMADYNADDFVVHKVEKQAFFSFSVSAQDCSFPKERVQFTLEIPIKSAQYLTWLNDRLSDENAQMTWKEEVLTCSFSSNTGLRLKE